MTQLRIPVAPKRGRLPWRYESMAPQTVKSKLRWLSFWLLACAVFWGGVYLVARHH